MVRRCGAPLGGVSLSARFTDGQRGASIETDDVRSEAEGKRSREGQTTTPERHPMLRHDRAKYAYNSPSPLHLQSSSKLSLALASTRNRAGADKNLSVYNISRRQALVCLNLLAIL